MNEVNHAKTATVAVFVVVAIAGLGQAAGPSADADESRTTSLLEDCIGASGIAELCDESSLGSYCIWAEVLGTQVPDGAFCIYWPN